MTHSFVLPILKGTKFIGRLDAKVDRKAGVLMVLSLHSEPNCSLANLDQALSEFAKFNKVENWQAEFKNK